MTAAVKRFLRHKQVRERIGLGKTALNEKIKRGEFPSPYPLGARAVGFLESDIDAWIDSRVKAAGGAV